MVKCCIIKQHIFSSVPPTGCNKSSIGSLLASAINNNILGKTRIIVDHVLMTMNKRQYNPVRLTEGAGGGRGVI